MLEGLEISEVMFKEIDLGDRIDAEFFIKRDIYIEKELKRHNSVELRTFASFVASAFYPAATQLYEIGDTPFIRCVDCVNYPFITKKQDNLFEKIPFSFVTDNKGVSLLKRNDIVITKVGTPCFASIVYEHSIVALSRTVMGLTDIHGINPLYLLVFLRSDYGFSQLLRARELTIQYQLTLERIKRVLVYVPQNVFQETIERIVKKSQNYNEKFSNLYQDAEKLLLQELGFEDWEQNTDNVSVKTLKDSFCSSGRLDAEYYQPKFDELLAKLLKLEHDRIANIAHLKKSIEPGSEAYQDSGIPFVRVADITKLGISHPSIYLSPKEYDIEGLKPRKDTILLSKDGSVGIAYKVENDLDCITSGALLHLSVFNKDYLPDYLTLVLNSFVVQMQAERDAGGSIIQHWKPSEIEDVIIPKLPMAKQMEIAAKIQKSFALRHESERLFYVAKKAVEIAISDSEEKAQQYITENENGESLYN